MCGLRSAFSAFAQLGSAAAADMVDMTVVSRIFSTVTGDCAIAA